jgi:hypothetical protein
MRVDVVAAFFDVCLLEFVLPFDPVGTWWSRECAKERFFGFRDGWTVRSD